MRSREKIPLWCVYSKTRISTSCAHYFVSMCKPTDERVHIDWQWPSFGIHSTMMLFSARPSEGEGCTLSPFHSIYLLGLELRCPLQPHPQQQNQRENSTCTLPLAPIPLNSSQTEMCRCKIRSFSPQLHALFVDRSVKTCHQKVEWSISRTRLERDLPISVSQPNLLTLEHYTGIFYCYGSGSAFIWLSWIRIRFGNADPDWGAKKSTKIKKLIFLDLRR